MILGLLLLSNLAFAQRSYLILHSDGHAYLGTLAVDDEHHILKAQIQIGGEGGSLTIGIDMSGGEKTAIIQFGSVNIPPVVSGATSITSTPLAATIQSVMGLPEAWLYMGETTLWSLELPEIAQIGQLIAGQDQQNWSGVIVTMNSLEPSSANFHFQMDSCLIQPDFQTHGIPAEPLPQLTDSFLQSTLEQLIVVLISPQLLQQSYSASAPTADGYSLAAPLPEITSSGEGEIPQKSHNSEVNHPLETLPLSAAVLPPQFVSAETVPRSGRSFVDTVNGVMGRTIQQMRLDRGGLSKEGTNHYSRHFDTASIPQEQAGKGKGRHKVLLKLGSKSFFWKIPLLRTWDQTKSLFNENNEYKWREDEDRDPPSAGSVLQGLYIRGIGLESKLF